MLSTIRKKEFPHLRIPWRIPISAQEGSTLEEAVSDAFKFSMMTGIGVNLIFNQVTLPILIDHPVYPSGTVEEVYLLTLKNYLVQKNDLIGYFNLVPLEMDEEIVKKDRTNK
ncbi:MAG TPA: hypothetical protein VJY47_01730 [Candidatus Dojkabacteria bacterium]|nr:hypothetical protein [Candidatus Dojkabacteria bacterium]